MKNVVEYILSEYFMQQCLVTRPCLKGIGWEISWEQQKKRHSIYVHQNNNTMNPQVKSWGWETSDRPKERERHVIYHGIWMTEVTEREMLKEHILGF